MTFDETRLTAYAAGEPDPELAAWLDNPDTPDGHDDARREVEALREFLDAVRDALAPGEAAAPADDAVGLDPRRKAEVLARATASGKPALSVPPEKDGRRASPPVLEKPPMFAFFPWLKNHAVALLCGVGIGMLVYGMTVPGYQADPELKMRLDSMAPVDVAAFPVDASSGSTRESADTRTTAQAALTVSGKIQVPGAVRALSEPVLSSLNAGSTAEVFPAEFRAAEKRETPAMEPDIPPARPAGSEEPLQRSRGGAAAPVMAASDQEETYVVNGTIPLSNPAGAPAPATPLPAIMPHDYATNAPRRGVLLSPGSTMSDSDARLSQPPPALPAEELRMGKSLTWRESQLRILPRTAAGRRALTNESLSRPPVSERLQLGAQAADDAASPVLGLTIPHTEFRKEDSDDEDKEAVDPSTGYAIPLPPTIVTSPAKMDRYDPFTENDFVPTAQNAFSTFAIEADTAAYALVRAHLTQGQRPPRAAVRLEELINYFPYDYAPPVNPNDAFVVHSEAAACPWNPGHLLLKLGVKGKTFPRDARPPLNLTFLVDVSGSMHGATRIELVKFGLRELVTQLDARDRVSIVTYANGTDLRADSVPGNDRQKLLALIAAFTAAGGTNGEGGVQLAYKTAMKNVKPGVVNRVILCTDGDFNIGITDRDTLGRFVEEQAKKNIFLSVLGFGMGNHRDDMLEHLSRKGHGNHAYIDNRDEARKNLVEQMLGTLVTIAKDVKIQVEFNPATVVSYRLLGYENRLMAREDFDNDAKAGGDIGAGHSVTALYELIPVAGKTMPDPSAPSRYQQGILALTEQAQSGEWGLVRIRDKTPEGETSRLREFPVNQASVTTNPSPDFRFAAAVAAWGMLLRDSQHKGNATWASVRENAAAGLAHDPNGYRKEFLSLVEKSETLR